MSIRVFQQNRLMVGVAATLSLVLLAALVVAAISARAESNNEHSEHGDEVTLESLIGDELAEDGPTGNVFPDDLRVQYQLKFGEADDGELGMRRNHVINVHEANTLRMMRLDFPPGTGSPWHTHPQPLVIGIAEGELTVKWAADCKERTYRAGEALVDFGQEIMAVNHPDNEETAVLYVMALGIPDGVPFTEVQEDFDDPC